MSLAEREYVYGFGVERRPARDIAVDPGLYRWNGGAKKTVSVSCVMCIGTTWVVVQ